MSSLLTAWGRPHVNESRNDGILAVRDTAYEVRSPCERKVHGLGGAAEEMSVFPWHAALSALHHLGVDCGHPVASRPREALDGVVELRKREVLALGDEDAQ